MRKIILSLSAALLASTPAWAINCQVQTNCTTLGYTSSKDEGNCLKCPFGNQWACLKADTSCPEDSSGSNCNVGDILYSDMTCSSDVITSKTPIAVVSDTTNSLAFALEEENKSWSTTLFDVPNLTNVEITGKEDWEGKENTQTIVKYCSNNMKSCPAAEYVNNYKTKGTSAGDWYLPSKNELALMLTNKTILDGTLAKISAAQLNNDYWSSTEAYKEAALAPDIFGNIMIVTKTTILPVRPVLKFPVSSGGDNSDTDTKTCKIGDILYSDKTCSTDYDFNKTPIGLIFDSDKRRAMSIEVEKFGTWSTVYADAPTLPNIEDSTSALSDWNGKENTKAIAEYCKSKSYSCPAVEYISSYKTVGTSAGDWYLPALGELQAIYKNILILNYGLSKIYNRKIPTSDHYRWSSTESGGQRAGIWTLYFVNGEAQQTNKASSGYILPVIKY